VSISDFSSQAIVLWPFVFGNSEILFPAKRRFLNGREQRGLADSDTPEIGRTIGFRPGIGDDVCLTSGHLDGKGPVGEHRFDTGVR